MNIYFSWLFLLSDVQMKTKIEKIDYMQEYTPFLEHFVARLETKFSPKIKQVYLYGSLVSGGFSKESDIDILIVVDKKTDELNSEIHDLAFDMISWKIKRLASVFVMGQKKFDSLVEAKYPFIMNVKKGVILA